MDFKIEKYYKDDFSALLAKTCKKFKVDYTVSFSDEQVIGTKHIIDNRQSDDFYGGFASFGNKEKTEDIIGYIATVEVPELNKMEETGFLYLGCIKDEDVLSVHPTGYAEEKGFELSSLKDEISTFPCVECGRKIERKIIHVFESPEGDIAVYGSGCAVKKFGINFTAVMDKFFNAISVIEESYYGDDDYFSGGSDRSYTHYAPFFAFICFYNIYKFGYVSGSKAWNEGGVSTKDATLEDILMIDSVDESVEGKALRAALKVFTEETKLKWEEMVAWIPTFQATLKDDDFGFNMNQVCEMMLNNGVSDRMAGYATYVVFRYWQDALAPKEPKVEFNTDYTGIEVGSKLKDLGPITVKIIGVFTRETDWGVTNIYTLLDVNTNIKYKWFSTSVELNEEVVYEIYSGTVKSFQDDAKYGKAIILTRCRVRVAE